MITVHHLEHSRSQRILWLLEELGVDYELIRYARDPETSLAPPELTKIHPLGKAPIIVDDGLTLAESGAIIQYLVERHGNGRFIPPEDTQAALDYVYWLHYAEGTFMPYMIISLILTRIETAKLPFFVKPVAKGIVGRVRQGFLDANVRRNLDFMESTLGRTTWFAGDEFTAADVQMSFAVEAAEVRTHLSTEYPRLARFLERIRSRDAYQRALEKGGPYELLGAKRNNQE